MTNPRSIALLLVIAAAPAAAQLGSIVGPPAAPIGCPIQISISNDTSAAVQTGVCPFLVKTSAGKLVFSPICIQIVVDIDPGGTFTTSWGQVDNAGLQVPAGAYLIEVTLPGGTVQQHKLEIGSGAAAIAPLGVPKVGTQRGFALCAPNDGGFPYLLAAALATSPGIPTCGGTVPLAADVLFVTSLSNPATFAGFVGQLDASGLSQAPILALPKSAGLVGLDFALAFAVLDPAAACPLRRISAPLQLKIS